MARKHLLTCGILSSLLYVAMNVFMPMGFPGYSSVTQTVSELSAIDAPTRNIWLVFALVYTLLFLAFGLAVLRYSLQNRQLRMTAYMIITYGIVSLAWPFAPMHLRGEKFAVTDAMHIALGMITIVLMLLIMGFGAVSMGKTFRYYTIASIILFIFFGTLTGLEAPNIASNLPTPWIGAWERINIAIFLLWVIILALLLLKDEHRV